MDRLHEDLNSVFAGGIDKITWEKEDGKGEQFASVLEFCKVSLKSGEEVEALVKVALQGKARDSHRDSSLMFSNELAMYSEVIPFLKSFHRGHAPTFPKMYFGRASLGQSPLEDIIVLEDLRSQNFQPSKPRVFLDYDHMHMMMTDLGEFHGLSYLAKAAATAEFHKHAKLLKPVDFNKENKEEMKAFMMNAFHRGIQPLLDSSEVKSSQKEVLRNVLSVFGTDYDRIHQKLLEVDEPYAVICHGDFNRNNVLFRYDEDGKPDQVIFIDLQTSIYADPAWDIAFVLYMNTTEELRQKHWDDFFSSYWSGLTSVQPSPPFTKEKFLDNFKKRAVVGFIPTSFFLPMMMAPPSELLPIDKFAELTKEEKKKWMDNIGGTKGTAATSAIAKHLLDLGCLNSPIISL